MAVHSGNTPDQNAQGTPQALGAQVYTTSSSGSTMNAAQDQGADKWSFGARTSNGINTTRSSATIAEIKKYLEENSKAIFQDSPNSPKVTILYMDNASEEFANLQYSAIVLVTQLRNNLDRVAYYPIALEKTRLRELGEQVFETEGQVITIPWTASEALNDAYYQAATSLVAANFPNAVILPVAGMVTGPKLDLVNDHQALLNLLDNAANATFSTLLSASGQYRNLLALSELDKSSTKLIGVEVMGIAQDNNLQDLPVREDVKLELYSQSTVRQINPNNRNQNTFNLETNQRQMFSKIGGFFDFSFRDRPAQLPYGNQAINPLESSRALMPRFVVTTAQMGTINNYSALALAIASLYPLTNQQVWTSVLWQRMQKFRMEASSKDFDPTDTGVLNILTGMVDPKSSQKFVVDTKEQAFGAGEFARFMNMVASPEIAISIDVPRASEQSWCWNILTGIAQGNPDAMKEFVASVDALTDGKFSVAFAKNLNLAPGQEGLAGTQVGHFFSEAGNQLPDGYFNQAVGKDHEQQARSVKNIDLLYMMNKFYPKQEELITEFARDFIPSAFASYVTRVGGLLTKLRSVSNFVLTNFTDRQTFTPALLSAIWQSTAQAGLTPQVVFPGMIGAPTTQSLYAPFTNQGIASQNVQFAQFGNPTQNGNIQGTNYTFSHWNSQGGNGYTGVR